jgi:hypothetical protein
MARIIARLVVISLITLGIVALINQNSTVQKIALALFVAEHIGVICREYLNGKRQCAKGVNEQ